MHLFLLLSDILYQSYDLLQISFAARNFEIRARIPIMENIGGALYGELRDSSQT